MLVLSRKKSERIRIRIGTIEVWVTVVETRGGKVRIGLAGPPEAEFDREELAILKDAA